MKRRLQSRLSSIKEGKEATSKAPVETRQTRQLSTGDLVLVREYQPKRWVTGVVLAKIGDVLYCVRTPSGVVRKHVDQLKRAPNLRNAVLGGEANGDFQEEPVGANPHGGVRREENAIVAAEDELEPRNEEVPLAPPAPTVEPPEPDPPL